MRDKLSTSHHAVSSWVFFVCCCLLLLFLGGGVFFFLGGGGGGAFLLRNPNSDIFNMMRRSRKEVFSRTSRIDHPKPGCCAKRLCENFQSHDFDLNI